MMAILAVAARERRWVLVTAILALGWCWAKLADVAESLTATTEWTRGGA